jgi:mannose-1-phosphate guanylyltransferase
VRNQERPERQFAIVLAGGEGTRLAALTHAVHARPVPKQFATLYGDRSFLQKTLDRIGPIVPSQRTVVVVSEDHAEIAAGQIGEYPGIEIVHQPSNRGTGAGLLLPLAHVLAREPDPVVVVLPSDHHFSREVNFREAVRRAMLAAGSAPEGVVLVGAAAEAPSIDLGWIVCGAARGPRAARARRVESFQEKPDGDTARALHRQGALWNTLVIAARGQALWSLAERHVPAICPSLLSYRTLIGDRAAKIHLREVYSTLPATDLSRDILQRAKGLLAISMADAGWSDCGTPKRLFRALKKSGELTPLLARLQGPFGEDDSIFATSPSNEV